MKGLDNINFLCIVTVSLVAVVSSTCKPRKITGRNDHVFQKVTKGGSSYPVFNESEHCPDRQGSLNEMIIPHSSEEGRLLRRIRSGSSKEEKYPTEDDRTAVRLILDKLNLTARLYKILQEDHLYCPTSRSCLMPPRLHFFSLFPYYSCCKQCSCDRDCHSSNTCCADVNTITYDQSTTCIALQYLPYGKSKVNNKYQVKAVTKCHSNFTAIETRNLCESQERKQGSMNTSLPVFVNGTVYRNRYCAICNFELEYDIIPFQGQIKCPSTTGIYASSITNLLQNLEDEKRCNILYYNPVNVNAIMSNECNAGLVRECNVTGKWDHYDPGVEQACLAYTHVYRSFYRNIFCYMCNSEAIPVMRCSRDDLGGDNGLVMGSFTAMLSFSEEVQEKTVDSQSNHPCRKGELFDIIQNTCVSVRCSIPFSYDIGRKTCFKVFEDKIITYELFIHITSDIQIKPGLILPFITEYLRNGNSFNLKYKRTFEVPHRNSSIPSHKLYHILFKNTDSSHSIRHILGVVKYIKTIFKAVNVVEILTGQVYTDFYNLSTYIFPNDGQRLQQVSSPYNSVTSAVFFFTKPVLVSRLLVCPFIILQNYTATLERSNYTLCVEELDLCFQQTDFRESDNTYSVCVDKFKTKMEELRPTRKTSMLPKHNEVEGVLSLFCTCISVASLLYVVFTFLLFKSLRTLPGKLILILSLSLLLAHLLYQFGLFQTEHPTLCRILGILIHFSWLWVIFWMNVSCFHMVSVFTNALTHELNSGPRLFWYVIYDFLLSLVFVSTNIAVSYIRGTGIGYGGRICWISSPKMVGYVFALPLGLVILSNFLMFLGVVVSLHRRPNIQRRKNRDRQDFIIFIKLTSITGISWVFGFLFEWFDIMVFSYIFIILTGCQGLYLMLSFSCNSRVRQLYSSAIKGSTHSSGTSVSSSVYHLTRSSKEFRA